MPKGTPKSLTAYQMRQVQDQIDEYDERLIKLENKLEGFTDHGDSRHRRTNERVTEHDALIGAHDAALDSLDAQIDSLQSDVTGLRSKIDLIDHHSAALDSLVQLSEMHATIGERVIAHSASITDLEFAIVALETRFTLHWHTIATGGPESP